MEAHAREAFFSSLHHRRYVQPTLVLRVRRHRLMEDSLRQISENEDNLKKKLFIAFEGEEGVDGGGLRKEWFLLLTKQLFNPQVHLGPSHTTLAQLIFTHRASSQQFGMFSYDEDSHFAWFNPSAFENSSEFSLVGIVIGLAAYHSASLDIPIPLVRLPSPTLPIFLGHPLLPIAL
jgi:HECT-domain (ubiquitin-transferase)